MNKKYNIKEQLKDPRFSQWLILSHSPATWVHKSWIDVHLPDIHNKLLHKTATQRFLKEQLQLAPLEWSFFDNSLACTLFVPSQSLMHIMSVLGALCYHLQLKTIIDKRFRQQLFECLPKSSLDYIEKTGPLLLSRRPELFDVLQETMPLWDPRARQLVDLTEIGSIVLYRALEFSVLENCANSHGIKPLLTGLKRKSINSQLLVWKHYFDLKLACQGDTNRIYEEIFPVADAPVVTLVKKIFRHFGEDI